jgi:hypothetical protein
MAKSRLRLVTPSTFTNSPCPSAGSRRTRAEYKQWSVAFYEEPRPESWNGVAGNRWAPACGVAGDARHMGDLLAARRREFPVPPISNNRKPWERFQRWGSKSTGALSSRAPFPPPWLNQPLGQSKPATR